MSDEKRARRRKLAPSYFERAKKVELAEEQTRLVLAKVGLHEGDIIAETIIDPSWKGVGSTSEGLVLPRTEIVGFDGTEVMVKQQKRLIGSEVKHQGVWVRNRIPAKTMQRIVDFMKYVSVAITDFFTGERP